MATKSKAAGTADDMRHSAEDIPEWATGGVAPAASSEVALRGQGAEIAETGGPALKSLLDWLVQEATETDEDTFAGLESIVAQMLSAESPEDVLREQAPVSGKNFVDVPFTCHGFKLREGDYEEGAPFYAVLDVEIGSPPERRVITCGGWTVLAQLMKLRQLGDWPLVMKFTAKKTQKGYQALRLQMPM